MIAIISVLLSGCQNSGDSFLAYQDMASAAAYRFDNRLVQADFFAKDLAIITKNENNGGDQALTAGAALLIDRSDHSVLYADHAYDKLYPASITKLLTALVVLHQGELLRHGDLNDKVTFGYNAVHITEIGAKLCGFQEGDSISMKALLSSMLVYSGNDAAVAIAEHVGGSVEDFVKLMNEEAKKLGAVHSHFVNPNGLHDDDQYTTAYDLYLIFNELLQYDTFRSIIPNASYTAKYTDKNGNDKQKTFKTTDLYLKQEAATDPGIIVIGGKTGTTQKAGNCLILLSKDKNNKEYISVILKARGKNDLYTEMTHLLSKEITE
jgi:D-alanyl-D-alanine carboxypeptidase